LETLEKWGTNKKEGFFEARSENTPVIPRPPSFCALEYLFLSRYHVDHMEDISLKVPTKETYGCEFLVNAPNQLVRELTAYALTRGKFGVHLCRKLGLDISKTELRSPFQHCVNACQMLYREGLDIQVRGYINTNTLRVLEALCKYDDIGIAGNAGSSKTTPCAAWCVQDWLAFPSVTTSLVASTALQDSERRIWGRINSMYKNASKVMKSMGGTMGELIEYRKTIVYGELYDKDAEREYLNSISAIAYPRGEEGAKALAKTRGTHNERVRLIVDELPEMDPDVNDVRFNLKTNIDFIYVGIGNPASGMNPHSELCTPDDPREWEAVDKEMDEWKTKTGVCIFLSGERSPNFQAPEHEPPPFPYLLTKQLQKEMLELALGDSQNYHYWRNCIGFWPPDDVTPNVISRSFIANTKTNYTPVWGGETFTICGFDPGFTAGGDRCAASFAEMGKDENGTFLVHYKGTKEYYPRVGEIFEESIAKQVVLDCINSGVAPNHFGMDISSDGGKIMQAIILEWQKTNPENGGHVIPISSSGTPSERLVSNQDKRTCKVAYDRRITEYWFSVREAIGTKVLWGLDLKAHKKLTDELCERMYVHKGSKVSVETKKDMKARLKHSPDLADSLVMMVEVARKNGLEMIREGSETVEKQEIDPELAEYFANLEQNLHGKAEEPEQHDYAYTGSKSDADDFY